MQHSVLSLSLLLLFIIPHDYYCHHLSLSFIIYNSSSLHYIIFICSYICKYLHHQQLCSLSYIFSKHIQEERGEKMQSLKASLFKSSTCLSLSLSTSRTLSQHFTRNFAIKTLKNMEDLRNTVNDNPTKLVVIEWKAPWCGKCKIVAEELNRLSEQYKDAIFCEADIEESDFPNGKEEASVESIPTIHFIQNDTLLGQSIGVRVNEIRSHLDKYATKIDQTQAQQ